MMHASHENTLSHRGFSTLELTLCQLYNKHIFGAKNETVNL